MNTRARRPTAVQYPFGSRKAVGIPAAPGESYFSSTPDSARRTVQTGSLFQKTSQRGVRPGFASSSSVLARPMDFVASVSTTRSTFTPVSFSYFSRIGRAYSSSTAV